MVLPPPQTKEFAERILAIEDDCQLQLDQSMQSLQEISLLLQRTNQEVEKLSGRELQTSNRVRDMEMHLENYSREDLRDLYTAAHEVQLRLFMMRSQAEQLQNRQQHIKEYQEKLRLLLDLIAYQSVQDQSDESASARPRYTAMLGAQPDSTTMIGMGPSILSIIEAQEEERLRISRQIHDGPTQTLTNLILRAEICDRLLDRDVAEARTELIGLKAMINSSLQDTRRLIFDLRPMIIDDLGLVPTLRRYLTELARMKQFQQGEANGPEHELGLTTTMQVALFRFVQIVLSAILSDGTADHVDVVVERDDFTARLTIDALGVSGDRHQIEERLEDQHLAHRLTMLNAHLTTEQRPQRGFSVRVDVPIPDEAQL